jgi:hypothetical protein
VAKSSDKNNQLGIPAVQNSREFGRTFLGFIAKKDLKGQIVCTDTREDA